MTTPTFNLSVTIVGLADLTDAINNLNATYASAAGAMATPTAAEAAETRPTRGRKAGAKSAEAGSSPAPDAGASTSDPADALAGDNAGTSKTPIVDAGTGKPIEAPAVDRAAVKAKAGKLTMLAGGNDKLAELLKKHSPAGLDPAAVKFGTVPDSAIPAFEADVDQAIASANALAD
jgi:hypothetical protein